MVPSCIQSKSTACLVPRLHTPKWACNLAPPICPFISSLILPVTCVRHHAVGLTDSVVPEDSHCTGWHESWREPCFQRREVPHMVPTRTSSQPGCPAFRSLPDSMTFRWHWIFTTSPGGHSHQRRNNYINSNTVPLRFSVYSIFLLKYIFPMLPLKIIIL